MSRSNIVRTARNIAAVTAAAAILTVPILEAGVVDTATDSVTLIDNGNGTKTVEYRFRVRQSFSHSKGASFKLTVRFEEEDTWSCDDSIALVVSPTLTIPKGATVSNYVTVSHTFDPKHVEDGKNVQLRAEVLAGHSCAGTGEGLLDWPAETLTADPPAGGEPDYCDPGLIGLPGPFAGTTATCSIVPGVSVAFDPFDLPRLSTSATGYDRFEVALEDPSMTIRHALGNLPTEGSIPGIEALDLGTIDTSLHGYPTKGVFDIAGVALSTFDLVTLRAFDDDGGAPPLLVMACQPGNLCDHPAIAYGQSCAPLTSPEFPELLMIGCSDPGATITLRIGGDPGDPLCFLLLGLGQGEIAMGGGCALHVLPLLPGVVGPLPFSPEGVGSFPAQIPLFPGPVKLTMQAFIPEPQSPMGFKNSSGLQITIQ